MRLIDVYGPGKLGVSFELFPPKSAEGEAELFRHVDELMRFRPGYITCTYGAGGSTRDKTLGIVERVQQQYGCPVATHLTCVGSSVPQLQAYLSEAAERGIRNVVALRGDPPRGEGQFVPVAGGLRYANELVELIRRDFSDFAIAVAGYPETHQEAKSPEEDLANLARKVAAGAHLVITQLFYDNVDFFRFRDRCAALGIEVPIVPGVLPVTNLAQIRRITSLCGAKLPPKFLAELERFESSAEDQFRVGVDFAVAQVRELIDRGVPGVHFYVLNKSQATGQILSALSLAGR